MVKWFLIVGGAIAATVVLVMLFSRKAAAATLEQPAFLTAPNLRLAAAFNPFAQSTGWGKPAVMAVPPAPPYDPVELAANPTARRGSGHF